VYVCVHSMRVNTQVRPSCVCLCVCIQRVYIRECSGLSHACHGLIKVLMRTAFLPHVSSSSYDTHVSSSSYDTHVSSSSLMRTSFLPSSPPPPRPPPGNACGWLIMPSWFYASKEAPEHQEVSSPKDTSSYTVRSARTVLPRAATASLRSKAHRRNAHELNTKEVIKSAARKLLQSTDPPPTGSSGSLDATGNSGSVDDASFLARISFM